MVLTVIVIGSEGRGSVLNAIIVTGQLRQDEGMTARRPEPLFPLVDQPFLQRVVESIAEGRFDDIHVILSIDAERVKAFLGNGTRWGVNLRYHLIHAGTSPYGALAPIPVGDGPVLLAHGDRLPQIQAQFVSGSRLPVAFYRGGEWTGWAWLSSEFLPQLPLTCDWEGFCGLVAQAADSTGSVVECEQVLGVRSYAEALESQGVVLGKAFRGLRLSGREGPDGVWIGDNVVLDPTATLIPPVYLGERSRIGMGVRLGPNTVVSRDCVIDRHTVVANSTILPESRVGEALELDHVIVNRNRLINVRLGSEFMVRDDFILGSQTDPTSRGSIKLAASALRDLAKQLFRKAENRHMEDSGLKLSEMTDLRLKRRSIELSRMEDWLNFGPRYFLFRHENMVRFMLRTGLKITGLLPRGERNALNVGVRRLRLSFETLPAGFCGFRLIHLSDVHVDGMPELAGRVAEVLRRTEGDLCVITGDYRFSTHGPCHNVYPGMKTIIQAVRARHGIVGILGNHDYAEEVPELEAMGVRMLINASVEIGGPAGGLWFAGVDDPWDYGCDDLPKALSGIPEGAFKILLVHTPDLILAAESAGVRLYLCGHTHAGQIRLPGIGAIVAPSKVARRYLQGLWRYQNMTGFTSAGVGCSLLAVRFCCPPEIALIELRCGRHSSSADCCANRVTPSPDLPQSPV